MDSSPDSANRSHAKPCHAARRLVLIAALFVSVSAAADTAGDDARARFDAGDYAGAIALYEKLAPATRSGQDWYYLGHALRESGHYQQALAAYDGALAAGYARRNVLASSALTRARMGDAKGTLATLSEAVEAGVSDGFLKSRDEFGFVRKDPRFVALVSRAERKSHPCMHDARYGALDFWVGEWEVYSGQALAGTNRISKIMDGCIVLEQWQSASGGRGQSMNYYDPRDRAWRQDWVDAGGGVVHYRGGLRDGAMHFEGEQIEADGSYKITRVELTPQPDGTVHHRIENSADGGKTWQLYFDGVYRRMPKHKENTPR